MRRRVNFWSSIPLASKAVDRLSFWFTKRATRTSVSTLPNGVFASKHQSPLVDTLPTPLMYAISKGNIADAVGFVKQSPDSASSIAHLLSSDEHCCNAAIVLNEAAKGQIDISPAEEALKIAVLHIDYNVSAYAIGALAAHYARISDRNSLVALLEKNSDNEQGLTQAVSSLSGYAKDGNTWVLAVLFDLLPLSTGVLRSCTIDALAIAASSDLSEVRAAVRNSCREACTLSNGIFDLGLTRDLEIVTKMLNEKEWYI